MYSGDRSAHLSVSNKGVLCPPIYHVRSQLRGSDKRCLGQHPFLVGQSTFLPILIDQNCFILTHVRIL